VVPSAESDSPAAAIPFRNSPKGALRETGEWIADQAGKGQKRNPPKRFEETEMALQKAQEVGSYRPADVPDFWRVFPIISENVLSRLLDSALEI